MERVPTDVIKGIFHFLGKEYEFEADIQKIHEVFFEMYKDIDGVKELMKDFVFDESQSFPYSQKISLSLDRLQKSNLLHCLNPKLDKFKVSESLALEKSIKDLFNEEELSFLKKGAEYFSSTFKTPRFKEC